MVQARILIVEDELVTAADLSDDLATMGYTVCGIAPSGKEAVRTAADLLPDLILMDIGLSGPMTGIEAAKMIRESLDIPLIYVTSHSDDRFLEEAKITEPFGYILKPLRVQELRTTIEIALYKHAAEKKAQEIFPAPGTKTLFVKGVSSGITLVLYDNHTNRFPLFKHVLEEGLCSGAACLYAYYHTPLAPHFSQPPEGHRLHTFELRKGSHQFSHWFDRIRSDPGILRDAEGRILCIADVSNPKDPDVALQIRKIFSDAGRESNGTFSGILAVPLDNPEMIRPDELYMDIHHFIVLSGEGNVVSFSPPPRKEPRSVQVISQDLMDRVVKKSLEYLILSCLSRPIKGYDIIREIKDRFNVTIPMARVYTFLFELEKAGVIMAEVRGKSRIYSPTTKGRKYIQHRLQDLGAAYEHVLGRRPG